MIYTHSCGRAFTIKNVQYSEKYELPYVICNCIKSVNITILLPMSIWSEKSLSQYEDAIAGIIHTPIERNSNNTIEYTGRFNIDGNHKVRCIRFDFIFE